MKYLKLINFPEKMRVKKSYNPEENRRAAPEIQMPAPKGCIPCKPKPLWICNNTYILKCQICRAIYKV